jgi:methionyl-tRNA synthetase
MLMALGLPLPKQVFGHPWLLAAQGKMSKSVGNTLYTEDLVQLFGVDAVRYYVLRDTPFAQDGSISLDTMVERVNTELTNTFGNLIHRTVSMTHQYFQGAIRPIQSVTPLDQEVIELVLQTSKDVDQFMNQLRVSDSLQAIQVMLRRANKYIDETEPWNLKKTDQTERLADVLYVILETARHAAVLLQSFIPETAAKVLHTLATSNNTLISLATFGGLEAGVLPVSTPLYQRFDLDLVRAAYETLTTPPKAGKEEISIEDFAKLDLIVGVVKESKQHPNADRLLVSQIDLGHGDIRQIVSGIADAISPEDFVGRHVIVVANLKPVTLRGVESQGMILAGKDGKTLEVLATSLPAGAKIS